MRDLKSEIIDILLMESPECHDKFISKFRAVIGQSPIDEQMRALSYFWNLQIGILPMDTTGIREYLMNDVDVDVWLERFKTHIVPVIVKYQLPL